MIMKNSQDQEFEKYLEKIEDPNSNYPWIAKGCPENPTTLEKIKYDICQKILGYKLANHLTTQQVATKIQLDKEETQKLLFCWINDFTLDKLVDCLERLFVPFRIKINLNIEGITKDRKLKNSSLYV